MNEVFSRHTHIPMLSAIVSVCVCVCVLSKRRSHEREVEKALLLPNDVIYCFTLCV